jgi:hypothetical protein
VAGRIQFRDPQFLGHLASDIPALQFEVAVEAIFEYFQPLVA